MKRLLLTFMIAALMISLARAETRQSVIYLEGEPEPITETLYETAKGFSFWYDADMLTVDDGMSESGYSLMLFPRESGDLSVSGVSTKKYKDRDWDTYRNHTIGFVFQSYNLIPHQSGKG